MQQAVDQETHCRWHQKRGRTGKNCGRPEQALLGTCTGPRRPQRAQHPCLSLSSPASPPGGRRTSSCNPHKAALVFYVYLVRFSGEMSSPVCKLMAIRQGRGGKRNKSKGLQRSWDNEVSKVGYHHARGCASTQPMTDKQLKRKSSAKLKTRWSGMPKHTS